MKSVRLFDYIHFDNDSWQVVAQDGAELGLKNLATGRTRRIPVAALLADETYLPRAADRLPSLEGAAVLEMLDPEARSQVKFLHDHVHEVLKGVPPKAQKGVNGDPNTTWSTHWAPGLRPS